MKVIRDPIDDLLKSDAVVRRDQHIDDAGFTLQVVDSLPVASGFAAVLHFAIPFGFTLLAAVFVALFAGGGNFLVDAGMDLATYNLSKSAFSFISIAGMMLAAAVVAGHDN